jgi:hypothetical protein
VSPLPAPLDDHHLPHRDRGVKPPPPIPFLLVARSPQAREVPLPVASRQPPLSLPPCPLPTHTYTPSPQITLVRGKGLLNAVVVKPRKGANGTEVTAWDVCVAMSKRGVLAKPTHKHIIRLAPPLVITEDQVLDAVDRIDAAFTDCGM